MKTKRKFTPFHYCRLIFNRTIISYGRNVLRQPNKMWAYDRKRNTFTGEMTADDCYEIGAW